MNQLKILVFITGLLISSFGFGAEARENRTVVSWFNGKVLCAVHVTDIPPIVQDGSYFLRSGGINYETMTLSATEGSETFELWHNFSQLRASIHWSLGHYVPEYNHVYQLSDGTTKTIYRIKKYIIIEPLEELRLSVYGGYWDDVLTIGDYELSDKAIIITTDENHNLNFPKERLILAPKNVKTRKELADFVEKTLSERKFVIQKDRQKKPETLRDKVFVFKAAKEEEEVIFSAQDFDVLLRSLGAEPIESGYHPEMRIKNFEETLKNIYRSYGTQSIALRMNYFEDEKVLSQEKLSNLIFVLKHQISFILELIRKKQGKSHLLQKMKVFFESRLIPSMEERLQFQSIENFMKHRIPKDYSFYTKYKSYFFDYDPKTRKVSTSILYRTHSQAYIRAIERRKTIPIFSLGRTKANWDHLREELRFFSDSI